MLQLVSRILRRFGFSGKAVAVRSRAGLLRIDYIESQLSLAITTLHQLHEKIDRFHEKIDQLHEKIDPLHEKIDSNFVRTESQLNVAIVTLCQLHEKIDSNFVRTESQLEAIAAFCSQETLTASMESPFQRLDGYLVHHASELQTKLQEIHTQIDEVSQQADERLKAQIDLLDASVLHHVDGYLVRHASELQTKLQEIHTQIDEVSQKADERLKAEIDLLDASVLHHMAEVKAALKKIDDSLKAAAGPDEARA
jgi:uncharacterized coiled-coil DUF342 family protein